MDMGYALAYALYSRAYRGMPDRTYQKYLQFSYL